MLEDGTVVLNTGAVDIGQGSDTVLTQMCAEILKLPLDKVALASPDTDGSPYNWGTTASRVTYTTGRAVVGAARDVERQIKAHAAEMLECAADDLELRPGGMVGIKGVPQRQLPFLAVSARAHWRAGGPIVGTKTLVYEGKTIDPKRAVATGLPFGQIGVFSFLALVVEVEVDETTGKASVLRAWHAVDVGRAINPASVEGQTEGGFVQGLGFALTEEMVWDGARLANPSLLDYKVPGFLDTPYEIHTDYRRNPGAGRTVRREGLRRDLDRAGRAGDRQRHQGCGGRPPDPAADDAGARIDGHDEGERRPCALKNIRPRSRSRRSAPATTPRSFVAASASVARISAMATIPTSR